MKPRSIFVLGTKTDVGKTYIIMLIAKRLEQAGIKTGYYKAVLSGASNCKEGLIPFDAKYVIEHAALQQDYNTAVSYVFKESLSPHLAAQRQGVKISLEKIKEDFLNIARTFDFTVVEGSGGALCPISIGENTILLEDIVKLLDLDVILVTDSCLGTINSTLLSMEYLRNRGINIKGMIFNNYNNSIIHKDNIKIIEELGKIKTIDKIERGSTTLNITAKDLLEALV